MYDKIVSNAKISIEEYEEVIIRPKGSNIEKVLSYRDEGNVSAKLLLLIVLAFPLTSFILDEYCCKSLCTRKRGEKCNSI